ncbi:MAG: hypothetical protein P8Z37_12490, partial [Acidobacteriota bacterium]
SLLEFFKMHAHSGSGSGIESSKPKSTPDCDPDYAFPPALSSSPNQAFDSAGGSMTSQAFTVNLPDANCNRV